MFWILAICLGLQGSESAALRFAKPVERAFAGKTEFALETNLPEEDILGVELFIDGRSVFYFDQAPFETIIDLSDYPRGQLRFSATLKLFSGEEHKVEFVAENFPAFVEEDVQLVRVPVMVQGGGSEASGYTAEQFKVLEDERPHEVAMLFNEEKPMRLAVLIDLSGSMHPRLTVLRRGLLKLLDAMRPGDSVHLMGFNQAVFEISPPETDMDAVRRKLHLLEPRGSTNLYGAVWSGVNAASKVDQRRALLVFTDGQHELEGSEDFYNKTLDDCISLANARGVPIYALGLGRGINPETLTAMSDKTGGQAFFTTRPRALAEAFETIGRDLRLQYLIYYYSQAPGSGWRNIAVTLRNRPELTLRYPKRIYFRD